MKIMKKITFHGGHTNYETLRISLREQRNHENVSIR